MNSQLSLKEQNAWLIRTVLLLHIVIFIYIAFDPLSFALLSGQEALKRLQDLLAPGAVSVGIIAIAKLLLLGLLPAWLRDRVIHLRWSDPLPGARAFSYSGPVDPRVDMSVLEQMYGPLPTEPAAQGSLFYRIYRANDDNVGVLDAHKSYLASRDIGTINFLMFLLLPALAYWSNGDFTRASVYAGVLFCAYLLMAIAAKAYGRRFVENALAAASKGLG